MISMPGIASLHLKKFRPTRKSPGSFWFPDISIIRATIAFEFPHPMVPAAGRDPHLI